MEAADAFDGEDAPGVDKRPSCGDAHGKLWPTVGAADGLRVEAAVGGGGVFGLAGGAHGEDPHGGVGAVVGEVFNDAEPRAAVGAGGEGVLVAAIARVCHVRQALITGGHIRWDQCAFARGAYRRRDAKALLLGDGQAGVGAVEDVGERRQCCQHVGDERLNGIAGALCFDENAGGVVAAEASDGVAGCHLCHMRPETHALHYAA